MIITNLYKKNVNLEKSLEKSIERIIEKDDMSDSYLRGFYIIYGLL
ncbi:hypothetical protein [Clostridium sp.]